MNAEEARIKSESGKALAIVNQWEKIMKSIEMQTKLGEFYTNYPDVYHENIYRLKKEGFKVSGGPNLCRINWEKIT
jgi:hypothetical protein